MWREGLQPGDVFFRVGDLPHGQVGLLPRASLVHGHGPAAPGRRAPLEGGIAAGVWVLRTTLHLIDIGCGLSSEVGVFTLQRLELKEMFSSGIWFAKSKCQGQSDHATLARQPC